MKKELDILDWFGEYPPEGRFLYRIEFEGQSEQFVAWNARRPDGKPGWVASDPFDPTSSRLVGMIWTNDFLATDFIQQQSGVIHEYDPPLPISPIRIREGMQIDNTSAVLDVKRNILAYERLVVEFLKIEPFEHEYLGWFDTSVLARFSYDNGPAGMDVFLKRALMLNTNTLSERMEDTPRGKRRSNIVMLAAIVGNRRFGRDSHLKVLEEFEVPVLANWNDEGFWKRMLYPLAVGRKVASSFRLDSIAVGNPTVLRFRGGKNDSVVFEWAIAPAVDPECRCEAVLSPSGIRAVLMLREGVPEHLRDTALIVGKLIERLIYKNLKQ